MKAHRIAAFVLLVSSVLATAEAGLFQDLYRGLDWMATPTGSPVTLTSDGTRVNGSRSGRLRIVPNGVFDKGYRLEYDRTYGVDSTGRPETYRFGPFGELTLSGGTQATLAYTQYKKFIDGEGSFTINNLSYDLKSKVGVQNAELTGKLSGTGNLNINSLGFYDLTLNVSNTNSELKLDGNIVRDDQTTNFDVGPISIKGNIFVDGFATLLAGAGADTSAIAKAFPDSPISMLSSSIQDTRQSTHVVSGETVTADSSLLLVQTILDPTQESTEALVASLMAKEPSTTSGTTETAAVPEPGTLLLAGTGAAVLWRTRRRA